jgi:hypothetical protein
MAGPGRSTSEITNYFAWGVQEAKDVAATTFYFAKHLNGTGFDVENEVSAERVGGSGKEIGLVYKTAVKADGSVVTYAWPDGFARLLATALGSDVPSQLHAPASAASQVLSVHYISPTTGATLPYLTMNQQWADEVEQVTNCLWSDLKIEGEAGKPIKITGQFISGGTPQVKTSALSPVVREAGPPLMIPGASALIQVHGGGALESESFQLTKFNIEIKNALDDAIRTLTLFREDVVWNTVDFNLDGTMKYVNHNIWNEIHYGGGTQVPVPVPTGSFSFFSAAPGLQFTGGAEGVYGSMSALVNMPLLMIANAKVNRLDPDGKTMYLDFTGYTVANATSAIWAKIVTGATASYTLSTT